LKQLFDLLERGDFWFFLDLENFSFFEEQLKHFENMYKNEEKIKFGLNFIFVFLKVLREKSSLHEHFRKNPQFSFKHYTKPFFSLKNLSSFKDEYSFYKGCVFFGSKMMKV